MDYGIVQSQVYHVDMLYNLDIGTNAYNELNVVQPVNFFFKKGKN